MLPPFTETTKKKTFQHDFFQEILGNVAECGLHMQEREHAKGQWPESS